MPVKSLDTRIQTWRGLSSSRRQMIFDQFRNILVRVQHVQATVVGTGMSVGIFGMALPEVQSGSATVGTSPDKLLRI